MSQVIAKLLEDHRRMTVLLDMLEREISHYLAGFALNHFLIETILDYLTNFPRKCHHPVENLILQRMTIRSPAHAPYLREIIAEHERLKYLLDIFITTFEQEKSGQVIRPYRLAKDIRSYMEYLRWHMEREESLFFPAAEKILFQSDWDIIETRMNDKGDPIFGREADRQYRALHKVLVDWGEK